MIVSKAPFSSSSTGLDGKRSSVMMECGVSPMRPLEQPTEEGRAGEDPLERTSRIVMSSREGIPVTWQELRHHGRITGDMRADIFAENNCRSHRLHVGRIRYSDHLNVIRRL